MGTIALPISWADFHRIGHLIAWSYGQPLACPICGHVREVQENESGEAA